MTLIVSCLTQAFAVQASDRRITVIDNSGIEDRANKALFLGWNTAWAYTGLATLDGIRTDDWICRRFQDSTMNLAEMWRMLASEAEKAVRSTPFPKGMPPHERDEARRLAFVGCGFARLSKNTERLSPFLTVISNFHVPPGRWLPQAGRTFTTWFYKLRPPQPFVLFTAGQELGPQARKRLVRTVRVALTKDVGPHGSARLLVRAIQEVSFVKPSVGRTVMCSIATPQPQPTPRFEIRGAPIPLHPDQELDWFSPSGFNGGPTFLYVPGSLDDRLAFTPVFVFPKKWTFAEGAFGPSEEVAQLKPYGAFPPYQFVGTERR